MNLLDAFREVEIAGNDLGHIALLFGIVFIAFILGKVAKLFLRKTATRLEDQQRLITASAVTAMARSVVFLFAVLGISLGLNAIQLSENVDQVLRTIIAIL